MQNSITANLNKRHKERKSPQRRRLLFRFGLDFFAKILLENHHNIICRDKEMY